jgi:hypothetical protein
MLSIFWRNMLAILSAGDVSSNIGTDCGDWFEDEGCETANVETGFLSTGRRGASRRGQGVGGLSS